MTVDGFNEIFNTVYIAKKLFDMGKYELAKESFFDVLDFDTYYENMYELIPSLFEYHYCRCYENQGIELHMLSDPVIVDFYTLAGEFGKRNNIPIDVNPYIKNAERQVRTRLDFSYCLDWRLMVHTEAKRPFHSRLGVFIYQDDWVDLGCLVYGLIEIHKWFFDSCTQLKDMLHNSNSELSLKDGVIAA